MRDIYGFVGYALFLAQVLEGALEQAIQIFVLFPEKKDEISEISKRQSLEEWNSFIEENDLSQKEKMLGRLLSKIRSSNTLSNDVLSSIEEARKCRNYVAHQYFKDKIASLYNEPGQDAAIRSLGEICMKIKTAIDLLIPIVQKEMDRYGYDEEYTVEFAKKEISRASSAL